MGMSDWISDVGSSVLVVSECWNAGDRTPDNQSMDVVGAFIGVDRLKILGVPHHIVLGRDTVTAQHVPGDARDVQRLAAVVALYERDRLRNKNAQFGRASCRDRVGKHD